LGYGCVQDVRQGKFFEIVLDSTLSKDEVRQEIERMAKSVLTNPVIEEFSYELETAESES
jgi:phosphoribosylformylglycinamidine synthase